MNADRITTFECIKLTHFIYSFAFLFSPPFLFKQHVVRKFLDLMSNHNIPVHLIDPLLLRLINVDVEQLMISPDGGRSECKYFCAPRDFTTFALLDKTGKLEVKLYFQTVPSQAKLSSYSLNQSFCTSAVQMILGKSPHQKQIS